MYPQEGISEFPLTEYTALEKPLSGAVVTSFACSVMIEGRIWGREPF